VKTTGRIGGLSPSFNTILFCVVVLALVFTSFSLESKVTPAKAADASCLNRAGPRANLDFCDLGGADLQGRDLGGASFAGANLAGANLSGAILQNITLTGANLSGANFSNTVLNGVTSGQISGQPILPTWVSLRKGYLITSEANLAGVDLSGADLSGANLYGADLSNADLSRSNLTGADLAGASLNGVKTGGGTGTPERLPAGWRWTGRGKHLVGPYADLTGADLRGANLQSIDLTNAKLSGVKSSGISSFSLRVPRSWKAVKGYLIGPKADLSLADLSYADLSSSALIGANLSGANLVGANFIGANTSGANLTGASLRGLCWLDGSVKLSPGLKIASGCVFGPGFDLSGKTFRSAQLGELNCKSCNFSGSSFIEANFSGANLANVNFTYSDLSSANLSNADLSGARLDNATLSGADLAGVKSGGIVGVPATVPSGWVLKNGYLIGPNANLAGANLSGYDLQGADLAGANLQGATLAGAQLTKGSSWTVKGWPTSLPSGWALVQGTLIAMVAAGPDPVILGTPKVGSTLSVDAGTWAPGVTLAYQWRRDDLDISGATSLSYVPVAADSARSLSVKVTGSMDGYTSTRLTSKSVSIPSMIFPTPVLLGAPNVGSTLTAASGIWEPGVILAFQWLRDGLVISGAASDKYTLVDDDAAHKISVSVTGAWPGFSSPRQVSASVSVPGKVMKIGLTKVTGSYRVGQILNASCSIWARGAKVTYQWMLDGKPIKGATAKSLKLLPSFKGRRISLIVVQRAVGFNEAKFTTTSTRVG